MQTPLTPLTDGGVYAGPVEPLTLHAGTAPQRLAGQPQLPRRQVLRPEVDGFGLRKNLAVWHKTEGRHGVVQLTAVLLMRLLVYKLAARPDARDLL